MEADRPMDEMARAELEAWTILWEVRELLRSVPLVRRRALMEHAIQEANEKNGHNTIFEQEVRDFMADALAE